MSTYSELMSQAQALMAQAEAARAAEISEVIADIRSKVSTFGLTADDIFGKGRGGRPAKIQGLAHWAAPGNPGLSPPCGGRHS